MVFRRKYFKLCEINLMRFLAFFFKKISEVFSLLVFFCLRFLVIKKRVELSWDWGFGLSWDIYEFEFSRQTFQQQPAQDHRAALRATWCYLLCRMWNRPAAAEFRACLAVWAVGASPGQPDPGHSLHGPGPGKSSHAPSQLTMQQSAPLPPVQVQKIS